MPLTRPAPVSPDYIPEVVVPVEPDPFGTEWVTRSLMPGNRRELNGAAAHIPGSNKIVVIGGYLFAATTTIFMYDIATDAWSTLAATIPTSSRYNKAVYNDGKVLYMRGTSDTWRNYTNLTDFSAYDTVTGSGQTVQLDVNPVYKTADAALYWSNDLTESFEGYPQDFYKFVPGTSTLTSLYKDTTNLLRYNHGGGMIGDTYYVIGGDLRLGTPTYGIFGYDVALNAPVSVAATMPTSWSDGAFEPRSSASDDERVYVAGGWNGSAATGLVFMFDGTTVTELPSLPSARVDGALVAATDGLYYMGGGLDTTSSPQDDVWFLPRNI